MDKNSIKKYAVWARRELIEKVSQKALQYGIEDGKEPDPKLESIGGKLLTDVEKKQRQALIRRISESSYTQVMEEVAYTWFNRFIALRFMEVNGYLPSHVRVFTDEAGDFKPQIMSEALHLELKGIDTEKVYELKNDNRDDDLFKYLLITQCNDLSDIFPKMFQKIADYTELLLPDYLLREGSVIEQMVNQKDGIPEADWQDQVQIIGWLYQYYNTEPKDKVFADLKKNIKITKETIPAATQLFTPDWIVHYMVENSLGRLWLEGHPNEALKSEWKYYLDEAEQEPDVQKQLEEIRKEYAGLKPEEIKCIDPCMGSGHILCVLFDTLVKIYEDYGYPARDAAASIVENNLWGLDIDERAAQLAYFAVMMKARQYDRRFLTRGIQPHVYAIEESNGLNYDGDYGDFLLDKGQQETLSYMFDVFKDAKEYGSILNVEVRDYDGFINAWKLTAEQTLSDVRMVGWYMYAGDKISTLAYQAKALSQKYHVVVTNPPYMGSAGMSNRLIEYAKQNYPDSKTDLFAMFIERINKMICKNGYQAMITQHAWMFLTSFEKLRAKLRRIDTTNMIHLGARAFEEIGGEVVQTSSFVFRISNVENYKGVYVRLVDPNSQQAKEDMFLQKINQFVAKESNFAIIPGAPIAYWISEKYISIFKNKTMADFGDSCIGMRTGDNNRFLRFWFEIDIQKFGIGYSNSKEALNSKKKWFPYCKGGSFRKWYGNNEYLVNWENDGFEIKENTRKVYPQLGDNLGWKISNENYYFQPGLTWSGVGARVFGVRSYPQGMIFDSGANSYFVKDKNTYYYFAGLLNCVIMNDVINVINPTINTGCGVIAQLPAIVDASNVGRITELVKKCIEISTKDWNAFETSWDFERHPLINGTNTIRESFEKWKEECEERFYQLKQNEEELNHIFIDIYGLHDELLPNVDEKDVTVRKSDLQRDIKSLISYAVGCMFGRYSLYISGIIYAGGEWASYEKAMGVRERFFPDADPNVTSWQDVYGEFGVDIDAIIPICDDEYFSDDIVGRFIEFIEVVYGKDTLEENLQFIADALGGSGSAREIIRNYFINDFYADHLKTYQKRPIYWLFDSGKKNGFKCLVYMHRYKPDTIARIRTDYVHEQQARYRTAIEEIEKRLDTVSASEKVKLTKKLNTLKAQDEELHGYEEKIHHLADQMISIDLDDGVKHNYALFQDVLAKIK